MAEADKSASEKLVNSAALTLFARLAMIVATSLVLPAALLMLQRGVGTVDEMSKKIDAMRDQSFETTAAIRGLQQMQEVQARTVSDHEARVRMLERHAP